MTQGYNNNTNHNMPPQQNQGYNNNMPPQYNQGYNNAYNPNQQQNYPNNPPYGGGMMNMVGKHLNNQYNRNNVMNGYNQFMNNNPQQQRMSMSNYNLGSDWIKVAMQVF